MPIPEGTAHHHLAEHAGFAQRAIYILEPARAEQLTEPFMRKPTKLPTDQNSLYHDSDTPELTALIGQLTAAGYYIDRRGIHLKIKAINFWHTTGTITIDSGPKVTGKGAQALWSLLAEKYPRKHRDSIFKNSVLPGDYAHGNIPIMRGTDCNDEDPKPTAIYGEYFADDDCSDIVDRELQSVGVWPDDEIA